MVSDVVVDAWVTMRERQGGVFTDDARALWAHLATVELPALPASRPPTCPSVGEPCDFAAIPDHAKCEGQQGRYCWCWSGCPDPECDHPACESSRWRRFQDIYPKGRDVMTWATPWKPWAEEGRGRELLDEYRAGRESGDVRWGKRHDPAKLLRVLERSRERGCTPVRDVGMDYLDQELALAFDGVELEARTVAHMYDVGLAFAYANGERELERAASGGLITGQLRLAGSLNLDAAPDGYQGALF